jgi:hypothetical protein
MGSSKFINQEMERYYLFNVDQNGMKAKAMHRTTDDMLWNGSEEDVNVRS